jgi:hypothetical protein
VSSSSIHNGSKLTTPSSSSAAAAAQVRKDHLLLTIDKSDSDLMQRALAQAPAAAMLTWRLDQSVRDTTARYVYNLQVIYHNVTVSARARAAAPLSARARAAAPQLVDARHHSKAGLRACMIP